MIQARYAVIATHNRPGPLADCMASIRDQVDCVFIIDNASDPPVRSKRGVVIRDMEQPPNLSRLWNIGLDAAELYSAQVDDTSDWKVAILNDDAIVPPGWMDAMCTTIEATSAEAACNCPFNVTSKVWRAQDPWGVQTRLTGWAFVLDGILGRRFDENLRWWCGDDDMSVRARQGCGLAMVTGFPVQNTMANTSTNGVLADQAAKDMQSFVDKWGRRPW